MNKLAIILPIILAAVGANALEISKVPEGKLCALSFTYDDGVVTHYSHALPMHLKYGFPGTFLIITDRVEKDGENRENKYCSWKELKEMSDKGMEVASHTKSHRNMREIESAGLTMEMTKGKKRDELFAMREKNWPELLSEVTISRDEIEKHCGNKVRTYAFGGNACPDWSWRLMNEVKGCIRVGNIRIATGRGDSEAKYREQLEKKVMVSNAVSCVMFHGLGTKTKNDGWNPIPNLETYESIFKLVKANEDKIHLDTFGNNSFYQTLAENVVLKRKDADTFELTLKPKTRGTLVPGVVWLRVAANEKVSVNGKPATPNKYGAITANIGDTIKRSSNLSSNLF